MHFQRTIILTNCKSNITTAKNACVLTDIAMETLVGYFWMFCRTCCHKSLRNCLSELSFDDKKNLVETLLSATHFGTLRWKKIALTAAFKLVSPEDSLLSSRLAQRERSLHFQMSSKVHTYNQEGLNDIGHSTSNAHYAHYGRVLLSNSQQFLQQNKLSEAMSELEKFKKSDNPSELENVVLARVDLAKGRVLQFLGFFDKAEMLLKALWHNSQHLPSSSVCTLVANLAEIYCELDRPEDAENFANSQLENMKQAGWDTLSRTCGLHLSLGEAYLQQGKLLQAAAAFETLRKFLVSKNELNFTDRMRLLRAHVGFARLFHLESRWAEAIVQWGEARKALELCAWQPGFSDSVISLSLSDAYNELGRPDVAEPLRKHGEEILRVTGPQYWFACIGTKWLSTLKSNLRLS
jgi:tetratricopeptide (TPR) repeat protein